MSEDDSAKIRKALKKRLTEKTLVPTNTITQLLTVNDIPKAGKMSRGEQELLAGEIIDDLSFERHLPQVHALTSTFFADVVDPVTVVTVPTGVYRVTMRKLLRLPLTLLQQQAELMKLDVLVLDQEGIASAILINMTLDTPLIPQLKRMLLAKEMAFVYGINFEVAVRGPRFPSSMASFVVTPTDMIKSQLLSRNDLILESQNQGITINAATDNKKQLAERLVAWWSEHPTQLREPFTPGFARFLLETAQTKARV